MRLTFAGQIRFVPLFGVVFVLAILASAATTEKVVHNFSPATGDRPQATLVFDSAGNLYGTTAAGGGGACLGGNGCGTVFQLTPAAGGAWTYHVIHAFQYNNGDGFYPVSSSPLVIDKAGNLYGTTWLGGAHGYGCVFELSPNANHIWTETILYSFGATALDGIEPEAGVVMDAAGNLYGTTIGGGAYGGYGTVFELSPTSSGWKETVIYSFQGSATGSSPQAAPILDAAGNLYGTAYSSGAHGYGLVYELQPGSGGTWNETVLYNFTGAQDGGGPVTPLLFGPSGVLYGVSQATSRAYLGAVFQLAPDSTGGWTESNLHVFAGTHDGNSPRGDLLLDAAGNLYGTTYLGGSGANGTVFKLVPNTNGTWTERTLYNFTGSTDGGEPIGGVVLDSSGRIYGTTFKGGTYNGLGVLFVLSQ